MRFSVTPSPRVRFSVECVFPHLGKRGATSRKSAFCADGLTEKRILRLRHDGKAHSPTGASRKSAFCTPTVTQSASFRESPPQSALFRRVRFSSPAQTQRRLTEKRILQPAPHGKAHSARWTSRKSAFCADGLTEKRILQPGASRKSAFCTLGLTEKRILQPAPHGKAHSPTGTSRKSAFCTPTVTQSASFRESPSQSALFRRMRLSSPGQTWRRLTEKRILQPAPHGKAHSARWTSRKSAFCADGLTEKRILCRRPHGKAQSAHDASRKAHSAIPRRPSYVFL